MRVPVARRRRHLIRAGLVRAPRGSKALWFVFMCEIMMRGQGGIRLGCDPTAITLLWAGSWDGQECPASKRDETADVSMV